MAGLEDVDLEMADMVEQTDSELKPMLETHSPVHKRRKQRVQRVDEVKVKGKKEKEKKTRPSPTAILKLFRFSRPLDCLLLLLGSIAAIVHGVANPIIMLTFGDLVNAFINQAASSYLTPLNNGTVDCSATFPGLVNQSSVDLLRETGLNGSLNCNFTFGATTTYDDVITMCISDRVTCLTNDAFFGEINKLVFIFIGVGIVAYIVTFVQISFFQLACERQVHKIRLKFYRAVLRQNVGWFDANPSGELSSRLTDDIMKIHNGIGDKLSLFVQFMATFFGGFAVGFIKEWRITLVLLGFTPLLAIILTFLTRVGAKFASQEQKQYAGAGAVAEEVLGAIRTVVSFGGEQKEITRYDQKLNEASHVGAKKGVSVGIGLGLLFFILFTLYAVAFWLGGYLISIGQIQGGDVLTSFFAVLIGAFALGQAAPNLEFLMTAAGAAGAIFETIDRTPPIDSSSDEGMILEEFDSTIEFNKVNFTYPTRPDVEVLTEVSLRVNVGQTVALVGPSGCGKSTVIQLLLRSYDVDSGEVLVGGKDVRSLNIKWLRRNIGVVSQEPVLFDTTIAENIRFGREDATIEDIQQAAKSANAFDFITELPNGFDTLVGEGGTQMSGGQKQRIAIARALVRNPKILLLDEATSALDTESEAIVQEALDKAREGRTTIVVAHRLSTIQTADIIIAVEDGCVVETGSHSELMDKEGLYYELVTAQSYAVDEGYLAGNMGHHLSPRKKRRTSGSENRPGFQRQVSKQTSVSSESQGAPRVKRQLSKKQEEELDKEVPKVSFFRVIKVNAREWWLICFGLLGAAINACAFPVFAILFGEILSVFALPSDQVLNKIHPFAALFFVLGLMNATGHLLKTICFSISGEKLTARLRSLSFRAMLRQEIGWFDNEKNSTGALTTRLANDAGQVQGVTGSRLGTLIETNMALMIALVVAFVFSWSLTLVMLGVVPMLVIAGAITHRALIGRAMKSKKEQEEAGKVAVDSIENIRTVQALGVEVTFHRLYSTNLKAPYRLALLHAIIYGLSFGFSQLIVFMMYGVVFRYGAFQVTRPPSHVIHGTFNDVFRVFFAIVFGALSVGQASTFAPDYAKARLSANRIFALIDRKPLIDSLSEEGDTPDDVSGAVEVNEVKFNYPSRPDVEVLKGLSLSVEPGKTLALVGPSGCGKSTIVSLIERFYDPSAGSLSVDGRSLGDLNIKWLRSQIGLVSQEPVLFDTSIADNIRYGANFREVSDEEIIEAAKAANIHSFIETLPEGYSTNVGAKGTQMSGGQKQRIAIARALVRNPKILLLDEATSALDTESEKIVQEALDKAREGRTSVVIAHRLSTIYGSDCIAVIQGGNVVEKGTHYSLLALRGVYYQLNRFQMIEEDTESSKL